MQRRTFLSLLAAAPLATVSQAATPEWEARLIAGGSDESGPTLGLHIKLAKGWKTYWRVPGEAGIPPQIKIESPDIAATEILYPLPRRLIDASGEAIGYHDEVVFIMKPKLIAGHQPGKIQGMVHAFFGVCDNICKPAKFEADISSALPNDRLLDKYLEQVPKQGKVANRVEQTVAGLELTLTREFDDIFVEGPEGLYFRKPTFSNGKAVLKIDGLLNGKKLSGENLRVTASAKGKGLEQTTSLA